MIEVFADIPVGEIIGVEEVPIEAMRAIRAKELTRNRNLAIYEVDGLHEVRSLDFGEGQVTYALWRTVDWGFSGTSDMIDVADTLAQDDELVMVGRGKVRCDASELGAEEAHVGYTETNPDYLRRGYNARRLRVMNYLSNLWLSKELHSSTNIMPKAADTWRRFEADGVAEAYQIIVGGEPFTRWRFK